MARHAAPRSPRRRLTRSQVIGGLSVFGVASAVALGVLVAPTDLTHSISSPRPTLAAPTTAPALLADPRAEQIQAQQVRDEQFQVYLADKADQDAAQFAQDVQEATENEARAQEAATASQAAQEALLTAQSTPSPNRSAPASTPSPEAAVQVDTTPVTADLPDAGLWAADVAPQVAEIQARFGIGTVMTRPGHSPDQQHAADFMTSNQATGDALAAYALSLPGVEYVIWQQRYNDGSGWSLMEDRGGATANHFDHVHATFR